MIDWPLVGGALMCALVLLPFLVNWRARPRRLQQARCPHGFVARDHVTSLDGEIVRCACNYFMRVSAFERDQ